MMQQLAVHGHGQQSSTTTTATTTTSTTTRRMPARSNGPSEIVANDKLQFIADYVFKTNGTQDTGEHLRICSEPTESHRPRLLRAGTMVRVYKVKRTKFFNVYLPNGVQVDLGTKQRTNKCKAGRAHKCHICGGPHTGADCPKKPKKEGK